MKVRRLYPAPRAYTSVMGIPVMVDKQGDAAVAHVDAHLVEKAAPIAGFWKALGRELRRQADKHGWPTRHPKCIKQ